jgi:phosphatidylinositol glycan class N
MYTAFSIRSEMLMGVIVASLTVPFLHSFAPNNHYLHRLLVVFLAFSPIFIILTISYEGLFYFAFCITLLTWVRLEHQIHRHSTLTKPPPSTTNGTLSNHAQQNGSINPKSPSTISPLASNSHRALSLSDLRLSLFALFLLHSAFFSTGNIASVSTFSLDAVYRLIPVFDPFSQGALLLLKILLPFAVLSAHVGLANRMVGLAPGAVFLGVAAVGDYGTMRFFWCVKDEGSWLEIGTSISQFVISGALGMFVAGLEGVGEVMVMGVEGGYGEAGEVKGGMDEHGSGNGAVK